MPSSNNRNSNSNKMSMSSMSSSLSFGKNKNSTAALGLVVIIILIATAYYYIYKTNKNEPFENSSGPPNLSPSSGESIVALFYADWCPHCVKFKPDFKKASKSLNGQMYKNNKLNFVMVDCDKYKDLSKKYDVSGFPTVKIFSNGSSVEYNGDRSFDGLTSYFS